MKKIIVSLAVLFPVFFAGCTREMPVAGDELVTVSASIAPATRVAFTPEENAMKLSWEATDALRIISSSQSESYAIVSGFTAHEASFKGKEVKDGPFTVLLPGKYASLADLEARNLSNQVQKGNGSAAHLEYNAVLTGVKDCASVGFSPEWATANGAEFRENSSLRLAITLPFGTHSASKLTLQASEKVFYSTNGTTAATDVLTLDLQDVTVSDEDRLLTCFLDLGLAGARFSAASVVTVTVATDVGRLFKSFRPGTKILSGGKMYTIELSGEQWNSSDPFAGGTGTEADPFLIANYIHMNNIASVLADGEKKWFKMISDVDMSPKWAGKWDPLNAVSPYDKALDFNGDGHVIKGLTLDGNYQHGGFVSILNGRVRNVTFEDCNYTNGYTGDNNDTGIVSAFAGYVSGGREHHANIEHVTVKNCSITTSTVLQTGGVGFGGITGTSATKRPQFMQMIRDAKKRKFDLILTREVSRFARNTVDTLQYTRELKAIGVEVFFINDNIKTFDGDGELRLTIMATLGQDESRKTSLRVKSGLQTSMENGVYFGNGNLLGYDRVETIVADNQKKVEFRLSPVQAKTVRMIFDWYLAGHGLQWIKDELERQGRKTATGLSRWSCTVVSHVLKNAFYCGVLVHHKYYVPDFLEQKAVKNYGEIEQTVVQGSHETIVTKEEFERVQMIMESKRSKMKNLDVGPNRTKGKRPNQSVWGRLLICECGHRFNMRKWDRNDRISKVGYQC